MKTIVLFRHSSFFLFLLLSSYITPQEDTDTDRNYYKIINSMTDWMGVNSESQTVHFRIDSSDARHPIHFAQISLWGFRGKFNMHLCLQNHLLLPYRQKAPENAKISLSCKSENLKSIKLVASLFNEKEEKIRTDTLFVPATEKWETSSKDISFKGSRFFNIELIAEGIDSTYWNNRTAPVDSTVSQNLWIGKIIIEIDGIKASRYTESAILEPCRIKSKGSIAIKDDRLFARISALKEKKIIALGESFHGSEAFQELFSQIVKHQVLHNQCKLIFLEYDMINSLSLNSYIQGNENFDVDSLLYDRRLSSYSYRQLKNVLLFLKDYNKSAEKKVHLIGIDTEIPEKVTFPGWTVSEYLYMLNKHHKYKKIDTICYELMHRVTHIYDKDNKIMSETLKLGKDSLFKQMIGDDEFKIFSYCCNSYRKRFADKAERYVTEEPKLRKELVMSREIWMFNHAKELIDLMIGQDKDSKVLIYGHTNHLCTKADVNVSYTFGQYMKDLYNDQYFNICLVAGEGSFRTSHNRRMSIMPLQQSNNSLESALSDFSVNCLFVPVESIAVPHVRIRNISNTYVENQFKTVTPSIRYDAFIYKDKTEAADYWPDVLGVNIGQMAFDQSNEQSNRQFERLKERMNLYGDKYDPFNRVE